MTNEIDILNGLKEVISRDLNNYLDDGIEPINEKAVEVDAPDVDRMKYPTAIYIQPNYSSFENLTVRSDFAEGRYAVFILCKRDTQTNLTIKTLSYAKALYECLKKNPTLNEVADFTMIESSDFFMRVEGNENIKGVEISVVVQYAMEY